MSSLPRPVTPARSSVPPRPVHTTRLSVFLPKEHGSWSLALEPLVLGLLIAPSTGGLALATAAVAGFFARRPLKAVCVNDPPGRRQAAWPALALCSTLALVGFLEAAVLGGHYALWPLLLAGPLGGLFVYFDLQNESRAAAAEIVGSSTFALVPAALATLAGWSAPAALALAFIAFARNLPTVLTVRTYVRQAKGQGGNSFTPPLAAGLVAAGLLALCRIELVPVFSVVAATVLLGRSVWLLSPRRPAWPARRIGQLEAALGLFYVGGIALTYRLT